MKRDLIVAALPRKNGKTAGKQVVETESVSWRVERLEAQLQKLTELVRDHAEDVDRLVRIVAEQDGADVTGFVVTIDDITELSSAQRKARPVSGLPMKWRSSSTPISGRKNCGRKCRSISSHPNPTSAIWVWPASGNHDA